MAFPLLEDRAWCEHPWEHRNAVVLNGAPFVVCTICGAIEVAR
ncbi:MAG: hypothetical protein QOE90_933 [Thermoplasmata archaeon]|jgi:hypothetical protein|nr:hypothetical protein [Thermoplasmata archaeon]